MFSFWENVIRKTEKCRRDHRIATERESEFPRTMNYVVHAKNFTHPLQRSAMSIENEIVKVLHSSGVLCVLSHGPHLPRGGLCRIAAINILHLRSKEGFRFVRCMLFGNISNELTSYINSRLKIKTVQTTLFLSNKCGKPYRL